MLFLSMNFEPSFYLSVYYHDISANDTLSFQSMTISYFCYDAKEGGPSIN